jgi:hypothetical protein
MDKSIASVIEKNLRYLCYGKKVRVYLIGNWEPRKEK